MRTNTSSSAGRLETTHWLRVLPEASLQSRVGATCSPATGSANRRVIYIARHSLLLTEELPIAGYESLLAVFNSCIESNVTRPLDL